MDGSHTLIKMEQFRDECIRITGVANVSYHPDYIAERPYKLSASLIVTPENEDQIAEILRIASEHSVHIIPQGGGTKDAFGLCSTEESVILSLKKLSGILHHSVGDLIVTVLPGTTLRELQEALSRQGQFLPLDPAWPEQATLGGIVASNSSGIKRALYGSVRDHLIATRIAFPDGKIIRTGAKVVKNVAGYDMNKLFVGAMGTLGVFTELTFKIRPLPTSSGLMVLSTPTDEKLLDFQAALLDSHLEPCALEIVNANAVGTLLNVKQSAIFVLFEDVKSSVQYQMDWVLDYAKRLGMDVLQTYSDREMTEPVMEWLRGIAPNANMTSEEGIAVSLKLLSTISDVPDIFQFVEERGQKEAFDLHFHGGLYTGISRVCLAADWSREKEIVDFIKELKAYLEQRKGHVVVEFASKSIRSVVSVWGDRIEGMDIMRGIKLKFDPMNCLNRGRYIGGI